MDAGAARRARFFVYQPGRIDWRATAIQLAGTLFFNVQHRECPAPGPECRGRPPALWRPDALGSICFLVASPLAWFEVVPRLDGLAAAVVVVVDHPAQPGRIGRLRRLGGGRLRQPFDRRTRNAERSNLGHLGRGAALPGGRGAAHARTHRRARGRTRDLTRQRRSPRRIVRGGGGGQRATGEQPGQVAAVVGLRVLVGARVRCPRRPARRHRRRRHRPPVPARSRWPAPAWSPCCRAPPGRRPGDGDDRPVLGPAGELLVAPNRRAGPRDPISTSISSGSIAVSKKPMKNSAAAISRRPAGPWTTSVRIQRQHRRRQVGRRVGVGERAADRAAVADLRVADRPAACGEQWRLGGQQRGPRRRRVTGQRADRDVVAVQRGCRTASRIRPMSISTAGRPAAASSSAAASGRRRSAWHRRRARASAAIASSTEAGADVLEGGGDHRRLAAAVQTARTMLW